MIAVIVPDGIIFGLAGDQIAVISFGSLIASTSDKRGQVFCSIWARNCSKLARTRLIK